MIKPFPSHDSSERGSSFTRRPILLAKLPHVGSKATLGIDPAVNAPLEREQTASHATVNTHPNAHVYVDRGHPVAEAMQSAQPQVSNQATTTEADSLGNRTYYRHDNIHSSGHQAHRGGAAHHQSTGGILQMQRLITSHSGLIVTLALTASAILLLLTIVNPPEAHMDSQGESIELYGSAPAEIPQFDHGSEASDTTSQKPNDESLDLFAENWADKPTESDELTSKDVDLFDWDDAFHTAEEPAEEQLSTDPTLAAELLRLPEVEIAVEKVLLTEEPATTSEPPAATLPQTVYPEFDIPLLSEIVDEQIGSATSEMTELPKVPAAETLSR